MKKEYIKSIFNEHEGRYGYRRITSEMRNRNFVINHKTVQRLMQYMGIKSRIAKSDIVLTKKKSVRQLPKNFLRLFFRI